MKANLALTVRPPRLKYINKNLLNYERYIKFIKVKRGKYKLQYLYKVKNNAATY